MAHTESELNPPYNGIPGKQDSIVVECVWSPEAQESFTKVTYQPWDNVARIVRVHSDWYASEGGFKDLEEPGDWLAVRVDFPATIEYVNDTYEIVHGSCEPHESTTTTVPETTTTMPSTTVPPTTVPPTSAPTTSSPNSTVTTVAPTTTKGGIAGAATEAQSDRPALAETGADYVGPLAIAGVALTLTGAALVRRFKRHIA